MKPADVRFARMEMLEPRLLLSGFDEGPDVLVALNTAKFVALGGMDSQGRDSMESSLANDLTYEILTAPQHGTLSGNLVGVKTAVLTYVPTHDYQGPDSFTYRVHDGAWASPASTICLNVAPWTLPIGIPDPGFGIQESHWLYAGQRFDFDGDGVLEPGEEYKDAGSGPYTHYIDSSSPNATDTNNPYGTPSKPRRTIPWGLPAGSVVEIHNAVVENGLGEVGIYGHGTQAKPIFVRGPSATNRPKFNNKVDVGYYADAAYVILENLDAPKVQIVGRDAGVSFETAHIVLRNSELHNSTGETVVSWTQNKVHDVMFYNNIIYDNGTWDPAVATGDEDHHGIGVGGNSYNVWVLDNEMYHNSGDGIQINTGGGWESGLGTGHDFYVGRNVSHNNKQTGFWTKQATNVIFSQNTAYGHRVSSSSMGAGMGFQ